MSLDIIFETHSTSVDNEAGLASGWRDVGLSDTGREQARELGERRRGEHIDAVFCSDLLRAVQTAEIAFGTSVPIHRDRRLREYDYGTMTGVPAEQIHREIPVRVHMPFPEGESLWDVSHRVRSFLEDLPSELDGGRVLVIGHRATLMSLEHLCGGIPLEHAASAAFTWKPGWEYRLER